MKVNARMETIAQELLKKIQPNLMGGTWRMSRREDGDLSSQPGPHLQASIALCHSYINEDGFEWTSRSIIDVISGTQICGPIRSNSATKKYWPFCPSWIQKKTQFFLAHACKVLKWQICTINKYIRRAWIKARWQTFVQMAKRQVVIFLHLQGSMIPKNASFWEKTTRKWNGVECAIILIKVDINSGQTDGRFSDRNGWGQLMHAKTFSAKAILREGLFHIWMKR